MVLNPVEFARQHGQEIDWPFGDRASGLTITTHGGLVIPFYVAREGGSDDLPPDQCRLFFCPPPAPESSGPNRSRGNG
jgi:hypothetical protein